MKYVIDHPSWQEACNGIACAFCTLADEKNGECKIRNYIQKQPEIPQWIPCSERLPEEGNSTYLVTIDSGDGFSRVTSRFFFDEEIGWNDANEFITAWMPLPEPYKEEGEEEC